MLTVKEYATKNSLTVQAVYAQIRRKSAQKALKNHIVKDSERGMLLDDFAVDWLERRKRTENPIVIEDRTAQNDLLAKNEELYGQLQTAHQTIETLKEEKNAAEKELLQTKLDNEKALRDMEHRMSEYQLEIERLKSRGLIKRILNR